MLANMSIEEMETFLNVAQGFHKEGKVSDIHTWMTVKKVMNMLHQEEPRKDLYNWKSLQEIKEEEGFYIDRMYELIHMAKQKVS